MKPMYKDELRDALEKMELTQEALSQIIGTNVRTVRKYASGETAINNQVCILVRMLRDATDARVANMVLAARMGK